MLFKLSLRNIMRSVKDYAIYFFTLILGVVIFYVFNAIGTQSSMMQLNASSKQIARLLVDILSGLSVFIAGILGFLIIYASRFLIKRRNKEFAIYLTLGMSKRKISLLLFFETLLIGILSLGAGLALGVVLSQLMSVFVANLFEADMSKFQFVFSGEACVKTILYFGIIYGLVILFNTFIINKLRIINLIQSSRKSERIKLKNPILCAIIFLLSCIALGFAYHQVVANYMVIVSKSSELLNMIIIGVIATFLIFWSFSGLLMRIIIARKKIYLRGLNSFTFRQISSKINTTVISMTLICLMLFVTIVTLASCLSLRETTRHQLSYATPVDLIVKNEKIQSRWYEMTDNSVAEEDPKESDALDQEHNKAPIPSTQENNKSLETSNQFQNDFIEQTLKTNSPGLWAKLKDQTFVYSYNLSDKAEDRLWLSQVVSKSAMEKYLSLVQGTIEGNGFPINLMSLSDYNKIAKLYHFEQVTLENNQYFILSDFAKMDDIYKLSLESGHNIKLKDTVLTPKFNHNVKGFIESRIPSANFGIVVVPDEQVKDMVKNEKFFIANYATTSKIEKEQIDKEIRKVLIGNDEDLMKIMEKNIVTISTKNFIIAASIGLQAIATFVGLYLGIIFLISSAAILALKELSESTDNRSKFMVLRRLGADEKLIKRALFRQIAIFFAFPLILAVIHSVFGLSFAINVLSFAGIEGLLPSIIMTFTLLVVIYGGYFLLTYFSSKRIISEKHLERR